MRQTHDIYERRESNGEIINVLVHRAALATSITASDVRAEAQRRLILLTGARDADHLGIVIANSTRETMRLMRKGAGNWSAQDAVRAASLDRLDRAIEAVRAASNTMEASPPADYTSDARWPAPSTYPADTTVPVPDVRPPRNPSVASHLG